MIARFLIRREYGHDRPAVLTRAELTRRTFSIELSQTKEVLSKHNGGVHGLDLDLATGRYLLCGGQDRAISIHDTLVRSRDVGRRHQCPAVHKIRNAHSFSIETVQWYPHDNGLFTSSGMDGTLKLWDATTMSEALAFTDFTDGSVEGDGKIFHHAMSPIAAHGLIAVASTSNKVILCDPATGLATHQLSGHRDTTLAVAWSPEKEFLLTTASRDNKIMFWDVRSSGPVVTLDQYNGEQESSNSRTISSHNGAVNGLKFTPDGQQLLSTGTDSRVRVWDVESGKNMLTNFAGINNKSKKNVTFAVSRVSTQPLLFHPHKSEIAVYNLHTGTRQKTLKGHYGPVYSCIYHPVLEELYSGSQDAEVLVWSPRIDWATRTTAATTLAQAPEAHEAATAADSWSDDEG